MSDFRRRHHGPYLPPPRHLLILRRTREYARTSTPSTSVHRRWGANDRKHEEDCSAKCVRAGRSAFPASDSTIKPRGLASSSMTLGGAGKMSRRCVCTPARETPAIGKGLWTLPGVVEAISRTPQYLRVRAAISPCDVLCVSPSALLLGATYQEMRYEGGSRWTLVGVYERPLQKLQSYDAQEACQSQGHALFLSAFPFAMTSKLALYALACRTSEQSRIETTI
ncbi:hypothetical protein C8F01DRAFT_271021 [Mycena amicta]|nr:hypothetical protein C8F01DRAFT_271021 [Mycena amicta]